MSRSARMPSPRQNMTSARRVAPIIVTRLAEAFDAFQIQKLMTASAIQTPSYNPRAKGRLEVTHARGRPRAGRHRRPALGGRRGTARGGRQGSRSEALDAEGHRVDREVGFGGAARTVRPVLAPRSDGA